MKKLREELSLMNKKNSDLEKAMKVLENKTVSKRLSEGQKSERQSNSGVPVSDPTLVEFPDWNEFEFCTKKKGAYGPSKKECIEYYSEK